jgi:hypothetical protein
MVREASEGFSGPDVPIVSTRNRGWQEEIEKLKGRKFRVIDVENVEHINFILAFAAVHRLSLSAENRSFLVEPRPRGS